MSQDKLSNNLQKIINFINEENIDPFEIIISICNLIGWTIAIPNYTEAKEDDLIDGMIIGSYEYTNKMLDKIEKIKE